MDLELTDDQRELRDVATSMLQEIAPLGTARAFLDGHGDARPIEATIREAGWYAVGVDPEDGFGIPGLALLAERAGATAAPTLIVDAAVAARIAGAIGAPGPLATRVAGGESAVTLAVLEAESDWSRAHTATTVRDDAHGTVLSGTKVGVHHAAIADAFVVTAMRGDEPVAVVLPADAPGVEITVGRGLDPASAPATVRFDDVPVDAGGLLAGPLAGPAIERAFAVGTVAAAAEGIGAASAALDLALAYSHDREQFGRSIGSFQALQHVIAAAHVQRAAAWSTTLYAAAALQENLPDADEATSVAKAWSARATREVVEAALQVLGGIAFTWEHDVHLLQRRVLAAEQRFGDATEHERRIAVDFDRRPTAVPA